MRNESTRILEALSEAIAIARAGDNNLEVSHFKTCAEANWCKLDAALAIIDEARRTGMDILEDRYPYVYCGTSLRMIVPEPFDKVDTATLCGRLKEDAAYRAELLAAMREKVTRDLNRVLVVRSPIPEHRPYYAKSLVEIGKMMGVSAHEAIVKLLAAGDTPSAAFGSMNEENLERILADPFVVCGSDSSICARTNDGTHPRAFGSFPRFFRIAAKNCSCADVIRRMTSLPAAKFNIRNRGVIAPGYFEDLVLLELDNFDCGADFAVANRAPTGVEAVYVNGQLAYSPAGDKTTRPGRVLRIK
jgi:N-acyl-D-aspartate/D-glutamate deacylase